MLHPGRWWLGLAPLAAIWIAGTLVRAPHVERDIAARVRAATPADLVDRPLVSVRGRDARLSGEAFLPAGEDEATRLAERVRGVRKVADDLALIPETRPYFWSAAREGNRLTVGGGAPDPRARAAILAAAAAGAPGLEVADAMAFRRGAPPPLGAAAGFAALVLSKLSRGSVIFADAAATVAGEASTFDAYDAATSILKAPPPGLSVAHARLVPPIADPFIIDINRDAQRVVISGYLPPDESRARILAQARATFPGLDVVDSARVARGAPAGLEPAMRYALGELSKLADGSVKLSGTSYTISGEAGSSLAYEAALAGAARPPAGLVLAGADIKPPLATPYEWSAASDGKVLILAGSAPSPADRDAILARAAALFPGPGARNELTFARGAPANFAAAASFGLELLASLNSGRVAFSDSKVSLSGQAKEGVTPTLMAAAAKGGLPAGFALDADAIAYPAQIFLTATRADGKLTLAGLAPDSKAHSDLVDMAKRRFFGDQIVDELRDGPGAPTNYMAAAAAAIAQLSRLAKGVATVAATEVKLSGETFYDRAGPRILADLKAALPAGFQLDANLAPQPPGAPVDGPACQQLLVDLLARGKIRFETGKANLDAESLGLLDALAAAVARCPTTRIEIDGHTDSDGEAEANQELSRRRAETVLAYLVEAGAPADRFTAVGHGSAKPVASNETPEGKAMNRRIEFVVQ